jgi:iron complex outermembrane receptor protein
VIGDEAIVPPTTVKDIGVFVVEEGDLDPFKLEFGARYDRRRLDPELLEHVNFSGFSFSAGGIWEFAEHWHLALNQDRAQRAPDPEELFINGPHDATASFEIGNPGLDKETANQTDLELHYHSDAVQIRVGAYYNRFDNFIYLADTGTVDPVEGLPIRQWSQHDAHFHGFEGEAEFRLAENDAGRWDMRVFGDTVRAKLTEGLGDLPRIAPARIGASVMWNHDSWRASLGAVHYAKQDRIAEFETETDGFTLVNAHLSYEFAAGPATYEVFLDGGNLGDELARNATSQLKDRAPLPGRMLAFGIRGHF